MSNIELYLKKLADIISTETGILIQGTIEFTAETVNLVLTTTDEIITAGNALLTDIKTYIGTESGKTLASMLKAIEAKVGTTAFSNWMTAVALACGVPVASETILSEATRIAVATEAVDTNTENLQDAIDALGAKDGDDTVMVRLDEITAAITSGRTRITSADLDGTSAVDSFENEAVIDVTVRLAAIDDITYIVAAAEALQAACLIPLFANSVEFDILVPAGYFLTIYGGEANVTVTTAIPVA